MRRFMHQIIPAPSIFVGFLLSFLCFAPTSFAQPHLHSSWAIDESEIRNAACIRDRAFSDEEMMTWLQTWAKGERKISPSARVNSVRFENEYLRMLRLFRDLINPLLPNPGEAKRPVAVSPDCTEVICAAEQVFGKKVGLQLLYLLARYGVNGSHLATPKSSPWRADELEEVLLANAAFPDSFAEKLYGLPFVHRERSLDAGRQVGFAAGVFSSWNHLSSSDRYITIAHERAHRLAGLEKRPLDEGVPNDIFSLTLDSSPQWYALSGWTSEDENPGLVDLGPYHLAHPERVPSRYGRTNPREDFAESILKYRFSPREFLRLLGKKGRPKYDFIRDHIFGGVEFLSEDQCRAAIKIHLPEEEGASPSPENRGAGTGLGIYPAR